ncbi:polyadenylate-binding protein-interacting protein 1 [Synchiropus splendidus]|uniref:polyadenylate-binding protein-interacting protein 1 n=1 Tax=Synchiropus splendidus TaxID=270530 RepID=UPI00237ED8AA|nr:polyadenylate-binding protein-interacting protein 1 [Synchiropus splendidus]
MGDDFNSAPGAVGARYYPGGERLDEAVGETDAKIFIQRQPLRQPKSSPPLMDNSGDSERRQYCPIQSVNVSSSFNNSSNLPSVLVSSNLSATAPEFIPAGLNQFYTEDQIYYENYENYEDSYSEFPTLADMVTNLMYQLSSSPGTFDMDVEYMAETLNSLVTEEASLTELVELIYTQSTALPNFAYTGARLCNYLSHHLTFSCPAGTFRQLLLQRCRLDYERRHSAVQGEPETQKKFHSFVLFLGELYLHLEVKSQKGPPNRAAVLLSGLKDLLDVLLSNPTDTNLICAVKVLKLTGSVLEDDWREKGEAHMDGLIQRIKTLLLDADCSRDVKQMLLKVVELRSSNWGRVSSSAASKATPDNDPNYFMNEPTFYTEDGTPFTAADPEYAEKYQELLDRQGYFDETPSENGAGSLYDVEDDMDPEIEEAFESFCLEAERKRKQ